LNRQRGKGQKIEREKNQENQENQEKQEERSPKLYLEKLYDS
jgi:hypothetical protein